MRTKTSSIVVTWLLPLPFFAQTPDVITMDQESHHHLALHNDYVKVFNVEVSPGDSIVPHSHDQDTVAIAIGDQFVTVGIPGKPDVHQKMRTPKSGSSGPATSAPHASMGTPPTTPLPSC